MLKRVCFVWIWIMLDTVVCSFDSTACQCIHLTATFGQEWGRFNITSAQLVPNTTTKSGCLILFILGASNELVELQFDTIHLRPGCFDQIKLFAHLKEPLLDNLDGYEENICHENAFQFMSIPTMTNIPGTTNMPTTALSPSRTMQNFTKENFYIKNNKSIYSSDKVFAIYFPYKNLLSFGAGNGGGGSIGLPGVGFSVFEFTGKFKFHEKVLFEIDGYALPTTYCDYQFLPYSMSIELEKGNKSHRGTTLLWRYFYSPRYPAKYPRQIKCSYKFIGRCLQASDKLTVYDSKTPNKTQIIDVFCNHHVQTKVLSNGPHLLIEFESSSVHTSRGFRAKYRFVDFAVNDVVVSRYSQNTSINSAGGVPVLNYSATVPADHKLATGEFSEHQPLQRNTVAFPQNGSAENTTDRYDGQICPPGSKCDIILYSSTSKNGTIQSPQYPGAYPPKTFCRYEFLGKVKERIQIVFTELSLHSEPDTPDCYDADIIKLSLPIKGRYQHTDTLCGEATPKPIMSNGNRMLLEFKGYQSGKRVRGFRADFSFLENYGITSGRQFDDQSCSFTYNSSEAVSGWIHSPNFPGNYPKNIECNYFFHGGPLDRILISFTYFDVEGVYPCNEDTASDSIEFSNFITSDRKYQKYCGQIRDLKIKSDGKFFRITLRSNDRLDGSGFRAFFAFETEKPTTETPQTISTVDNRSLSLHSHSNFLNILFPLLLTVVPQSCDRLLRLLRPLVS